MHGASLLSSAAQAADLREHLEGGPATVIS
jgi:hypothetical protein